MAKSNFNVRELLQNQSNVGPAIGPNPMPRPAKKKSKKKPAADSVGQPTPKMPSGMGQGMY